MGGLSTELVILIMELSPSFIHDMKCEIYFVIILRHGINFVKKMYMLFIFIGLLTTFFFGFNYLQHARENSAT